MSRKKTNSPFSLFAFQDAITSVCGVVVLVTLILALELTTQVADRAAASLEPLERQARELRKEIETVREDARALEDSFDVPRPADGPARAGLTLAQAQRDAQIARERLAAARDEELRLKDELARAKRLAAQSATQTEVERLQAEARQAQETAREAQAQTDVPLDANVAYYEYSSEVKEKPWFVDASGSRVVAIPSTSGERQEFANPDAFMTWAKTRSPKEEYFVLIVRPSGAGAFDTLSLELEESGFKWGIDLVAEDRVLEFVEAKKKGTKR